MSPIVARSRFRLDINFAHTFHSFPEDAGLHTGFHAWSRSSTAAPPFGQTRGMDLTPASDVLLCVFAGRLGPRHFAGECAREPQAVSLPQCDNVERRSLRGYFFLC